MNGFSELEFNNACGNVSDYPNQLFTNQVYNSELFQFNYTNTDEFFAVVRQINTNHLNKEITSDDKTQILLRFKQTKEMTTEEAKALLEDGRPYLRTLNETSDNYKFLFLKLTSVGIAIAQANLKRRTGINLPLSTWIN